MRVRGAQMMGKIRQSQKEREKELSKKCAVASDLEFHRRMVDGEGVGEQDQTAATTGTITSAVSPNLGVQQKSLLHFTEAEEGRVAKRKLVSSPSGSQTKAKYSSFSVGTNTSGSIKEELVALNPQSKIRVRIPGVGWRCLAVDPRRGCESKSPSVSKVHLNQPGRASLPKVVHPAQSISEKEQDHEAIKKAAFIPVHNTEEINSEVIWEQIQKLHDDFVSLNEPAFAELLEQANKLVMENKRLKDGQIVLLQQVKDQKQMIDELSKQKKAEVDCLKEETAQLIKDKENLQLRLSRANELVKLITDACAMETSAND